MLKTITTVAAIAVAAAPAAADSFTLWNGNFWEVAVVDRDEADGGLYCRLTNHRPDLGMFHLTVDNDGYHKIYAITLPSVDFADTSRQSTSLVLRLEGSPLGNVTWTLDDAEVYDRFGIVSVVFGLGYDKDTAEFMADFYLSDDLYFVNRHNKKVLHFSLEGSIKGSQELYKCLDRIEKSY